jgi:hypothetical protein
MKNNSNSLNQKSQIVINVFIVVTLFSCITGCFDTTITSVNHLREAQVAFNESATLENEYQMSTLDPLTTKEMGNEVGNTIAIQNGYASALLSINKIYPSESVQLKNDKILGNVLFIKAMAQWRIGDFESALGTADLALQEAQDLLYPRDTAVLAALPGLIKIDLAFKEIKKMEEGAEGNLNIFSEIGRRLSYKEGGAVNDIRKARAKVNKGHEVNIYLIQAQLSAYRNYQVAYQLSHNTHSPPDTDKNKKEAQYNLKDLEDLLNALKKPGTNNLVNYWKTLCLITPDIRT